MPNRNSSGFTLIELMIVVAIVAILAAVALPAYTRYITKSRRAAAEACVSNYANFMERFYATNMSYYADSSGNLMTAATLTALNLDCATTQNTGQYYSYTVTTSQTQPATYTLQAAPIGTQLANDTQCGTVALDQTGARTDNGTSSSGTCWQH